MCSDCSMFALNMQFSTGRAATDQSTATLLAAFPTATGPIASQFSVLLSNGSSGQLEAVIPYASNYFLLRVRPRHRDGAFSCSAVAAEGRPVWSADRWLCRWPRPKATTAP